MTDIRIAVNVSYYAGLRERAGCDAETVATSARTPADLYAELRGRHGFPAGTAHLRVAVNDAFAAWDVDLADGDGVVFIPPVAGG